MKKGRRVTSGLTKESADSEVRIDSILKRARILKGIGWIFRKSFSLLIWFIIFSAKLSVYLALPLILLAVLVYYEFKTSRFQAKYISRIAHQATFEVQPGPSNQIWFPKFGPYDERLGYTRIPSIVDSLTRSVYQVSEQAHISDTMKSIVDRGLFPVYEEKTRTGLTVLDRHNTLIYSAYRPERIYENFEDVPPIVLQSLLYIENREILDHSSPTKNPAVEWDRLARAIGEKILKVFYPGLNAPGGSTIATQLEKYRHSRDGRTRDVHDKYVQMASASLRAYMHGEETTDTRKQIVLQYVNSIPLAALPGFGEVNGLGDGMWAWFGTNFNEANQALRSLSLSSTDVDVQMHAGLYKRALSLFIAHRRPSYYLLRGLDRLDGLTNTYLDLLAKNNIIPQSLCDAAKTVKLKLRRAAPQQAAISFVQRKAANAIRTRLLQLLQFNELYDLDQVDLTVKSSMDNEANEAVTEVLNELKDAAGVKKFGLGGARNLDRGDPSKVIYSLTMYERSGNSNVLRIQTDNFDKPFSINEGTRLDLGSTAKLRTLVTYLDLMGELYDSYKKLSREELVHESKDDLDPISLFAATTLLQRPDITLSAFLDAAMERHYSANPGEAFFTGGGRHNFKNFRPEDNGANPTVQQSLTNSINLPFVRIMRDISRYHIRRLGLGSRSADKKKDESSRMDLLKRFADEEGSYFMRTFYQRYKGKSGKDLVSAFVKNARSTAKQAAVIFRYVEPDATLEDFSDFFKLNLPNADQSNSAIETLYNAYPPDKFSLSDRGYLARVHPLELTVVRFLRKVPNASMGEILTATPRERQEVYEWLFKTPHRQAQDSRIRVLVEVEAFHEIHKQWRKVGYPFSSMVASLASAIGSSGDRPAALAELVGIILNDGVRYPLVRLNELHFGASTPFETKLNRADATAAGERVLKSEVAARLRQAMTQVVEQGTARRIKGAFKRLDGKAYTVGGKTGTGDHRYETYGPGGQLISSRVVNRTATFAFFMGDRHFGVISAHVPGAEAAKFDFTSALAAELLKQLAPAIVPMLESSDAGLAPKGIEAPPAASDVKADKKSPPASEIGESVVSSTSDASQEPAPEKIPETHIPPVLKKLPRAKATPLPIVLLPPVM